MHDTSHKQFLPHDPLLSTKLHISPVAPHLVVRPRLLAQPDQGVKHKLTLLSAPAGYGKTTLLASWLRSSSQERMPVAWISLNEGDNDPARFWEYGCTSLNQLHSTVKERILPLLHSSQPPPVDYFLTTLINTLAPVTEDFVLVLDEYHVITTSSIHQELTFLLVSHSGWRAVARGLCGRPVLYTRGGGCFSSTSA